MCLVIGSIGYLFTTVPAGMSKLQLGGLKDTVIKVGMLFIV
jgi:hypothetical protein